MKPNQNMRPRCGCGSSDTVRHGSFDVEIIDIERSRTIVRKIVSRRRFLCNGCGRTLAGVDPSLAENHNMTRRLVERLAEEVVSIPFTSVAKKFGLSDATVRSVFADHLAELESAHCFEPPDVLGLDAVSLVRSNLLVTNLVEGTVVDLLPGMDPADLFPRLRSLQKHPPVAVCVGMWPPLLEVAQKVFPGAEIAIPWRHLVRTADDCLEAVRKSARKEASGRYDHKKLQGDKSLLVKSRDRLGAWDRIQLADWHERFPLLARAYETREDLAAIGNATSSTQAEALIEDWQAGLSAELRLAFAPVVEAIATWRSQLLAAFGLGVPNPARWELPARIDELHRQGRGYSFDVLRARLLFQQKHKIRETPEGTKNYGVDIQTVTTAKRSR